MSEPIEEARPMLGVDRRSRAQSTPKIVYCSPYMRMWPLHDSISPFEDAFEALEPIFLPAGVGALLVLLLALRRGPQPWLEVPGAVDSKRLGSLSQVWEFPIMGAPIWTPK